MTHRGELIMTHQPTFDAGNLMNALRALLAGVAAIAVIGLVLVLAAFLTMAAFVVAGVAAVAAAGYWAWRKLVSRSNKRSADETILVARRGPHGWTVDGEDQPRGA